MNLESVRSNSSIALEKLRQLIHEHRHDHEWQFPPERELALSMGLGRRAVRRAMEVLEAEGLIWRQQGKGTFIGSRPVPERQFFGNLADRTNPLEVMEARLQIEPALARMAALRCTGDDIAALERLSRKTVTSSDDDAWELWDSAFHRRIAECAGNNLMLTLFDITQRIRQDPDWRRPRAQARTPERRERAHRYHEEIVRALASRDGAAAERAMRQHLSVLNADLQSIMLGEEEAASPTGQALRSEAGTA
ncbi:FadR/GntR family transcriptional regulator [Nitratireductor sp. ZSWI3]|uniref:FadR/GntR family transcriptional regulator n=1 Tax=Nitratireductor sp. ZSWI3 TaxID=2966359 RepID=UPI00214FD097|nr:FCD domain-containing protein [Nitratireductor sp. ZSWI3]MCR4264657.1 FCD domain-containing protein [Nitratireductor sp. ZSWI3]